MSDEIKEILELFKEYASGGMTGLYPPEETIKNLLNYITNLQTIEREYSNLLSENAELQQENDRLNNNINELEENYEKIVEMLSNGNFLQLNGKAINLTELNEYINAQQEEIERLNNIINELEKWCNECIEYQIIARENGDTTISDTFFEIVLDKLKELKNGDKDE